jgi:hypothetical protein
MAQHINIKEFQFETWYDNALSKIKHWMDKTKYSHRYTDKVVFLNKKMMLLPLDNYKMDEDTTAVVTYKSSIKKKLTQSDPDSPRVCDCTFEVHMNKREIKEIYIPM